MPLGRSCAFGHQDTSLTKDWSGLDEIIDLDGIIVKIENCERGLGEHLRELDSMLLEAATNRKTVGQFDPMQGLQQGCRTMRMSSKLFAELAGEHERAREFRCSSIRMGARSESRRRLRLGSRFLSTSTTPWTHLSQRATIQST